MVDQLPEQVRDFDAFRNWLEANFDPGITTVEKGAGFLDFVMSLIPLSEQGARFGSLMKCEAHSYDGGVDAYSRTHPTQGQLFLQSKFKVPSKQDLDQVMSAFRAYDQQLRTGGELRLPVGDEETPRTVYALATSTKLRTIRRRYESSSLASREFYDSLIAEDRLIIWDGAAMLSELQQLWRQHYNVPQGFSLRAVKGWMDHDDVLIGVIEGRDLATLYTEHGPGLFFENVRGFLGLNPNADRQTVNQAILETAETAPRKMLSRNNGIVLRAGSVERTAESDVLRLQQASIVNGLQTTICLFNARGGISPECEVLVKVVRADDAWEVAEAANNQNAIGQIDLKLARYFRPQIADQAAAEGSVALTGSDSASALTSVLASIRADQASYDELRYLLIGLFCSTPNQLFQDNYTRLRLDVLDELYEGGAPPEDLYPALFAISQAANEALLRCEGMIADDPVQRIHDESKPKYRVYLAILAVCASLQVDLSERLDSTEQEAQRISEFLGRARSLFEHPDARAQFVQHFIFAYGVAAETAMDAYREGDEGRVAQQVYKRLRDAPFTLLYRKIGVRIAERRQVEGVTL